MASAVTPQVPPPSPVQDTTPRTSDSELLVRVARGDINAFEDLYLRFARPVLGLAQRLLGDPSRAEDATQETFAAIWSSAKSYLPKQGTGSAWLFTVARNSIIDRARERSEPGVGDAPDTASDERGPEERTKVGWVTWQIHAALEQLPPNERDVIELAYFGGLSQSEITEQQRLPLATVKTRTRAGLARLAPLLEEVHDEPA